MDDLRSPAAGSREQDAVVPDAGLLPLLRTLLQLRREGSLTPEEFEVARASVLERA